MKGKEYQVNKAEANLSALMGVTDPIKRMSQTSKSLLSLLMPKPNFFTKYPWKSSMCEALNQCLVKVEYFCIICFSCCQLIKLEDWQGWVCRQKRWFSLISSDPALCTAWETDPGLNDLKKIENLALCNWGRCPKNTKDIWDPKVKKESNCLAFFFYEKVMCF